jgi:parallel beta-helix repeat protein
MSSSGKRLLARLPGTGIVLAVLVLVLLAPQATATSAGPTPSLTTGQDDYSPESVVDFHGTGFVAGARYALPVRRPDGSIVLVDPVTLAAKRGWDVVTAAADGTISYGYKLDGIQGTYEARAYPLDWAGDWNSKPIATVFFTDKAQADIDQCANGSIGSAASCPGSGGGGDWQNGDLNGNNSNYREGDSVPFRITFSGLSGSSSVTIKWQATNAPSFHAYDYLTTWKRTVGSANPCDGVAGCNLGSPTSTFAIPTDPTVAPGCGFVGSQIPGVFTMWGATITSVSAYGLSGCASTSSNTENSITITFTATTSTPVLAWGGHIADQSSWGLGRAAGSISGSPYHMALDECSFSCGSQDRALQAGQNSGVLPIPDLTTTASPSSGAVGDPFTDTAIVTGTSPSGFPGGSVAFYYCGPGVTPPDCSLGGSLVGTVTVVPAQANPAYTGTATSPSFTPQSPGVYCFRAEYVPGPGVPYSPIDHTDQSLECVTAGSIAELESGSLQISKVLNPGGSGFDTSTAFAIQYACDTGGPAGTVDLAGGQSETIDGIPLGSSCTVSEPTLPAAPAGYTWGTSILGSPTAPAAANETRSVTVTNTLSQGTGSLKVTKTLDTGGSSFDTGATFTIAYDCGGGVSGTVGLTGGSSTTISGIPGGSVCTVSEPNTPDAPVGYTWSVAVTGSPAGPITAGVTQEATVANSLVRDTGSLKVSKTLDTGGSSFDAGTKFSIAYDCGGGTSGTVQLAGGEDQTISAIPTGSTCTVGEPGPPAAPTGYSWSVVVTGSPTGAIAKDQTASVTVANTLKHETGSLMIAKTLSSGGSGFDTSTKFSIGYDCGGGVSGIVQLAGGQNTTIDGIPTGSVCTVSEPSPPSPPAGYSWGTLITGSPTPAIVKGAPVSVTVANSLTRDTGSLQISKVLTLNGSSFSPTTKFSIAYNCGGAISGTVQLAGGESSTIPGIPTGSVCTVTESSVPAAPPTYVWTTTVAGSPTAAIAKATTTSVTVTNALNPTCAEDPGRAELLTRTVITGNPAGGGTGNPGSPVNYLTVQAAYNAAKASGNANEVIGLYSKTTENVLLDGAKSMTITQCQSAQITAAIKTKPVWDITSTGKLTIVGPDAAGGTIGWLIESGGNDIKSVRSTGGTTYGIKITGSNNSVSFNSVSGSPVGIRVEGNANDLRGGTVSGNTTGIEIGPNATGNAFRTATVGPNTGNGIVVYGPGNTVRDDTFTGNSLNGVLVSGSGNTIYNNSAYANKQDGFKATGANTVFDSDKAYKNTGAGFETSSTATGTKFVNDQSNNGSSGGSSENAGAEYKLAVLAVNGGGNSADTIGIPKKTSPTKCSTFPAAGSCE